VKKTVVANSTVTPKVIEAPIETPSVVAPVAQETTEPVVVGRPKVAPVAAKRVVSKPVATKPLRCVPKPEPTCPEGTVPEDSLPKPVEPKVTPAVVCPEGTVEVDVPVVPV